MSNKRYIPTIPLDEGCEIAQPATENPLPAGEASAGSSKKWAREDHVHPGEDKDIVTYFNEALEKQAEEILDAVKMGAVDMDAMIAVGVEATMNSNNYFYYQVKAKQLDDEMQVTVCDRNGSVLGTSLSPFNVTTIVLSIGGLGSTSAGTYFYTGFNADAQNAYQVRPNSVVGKQNESATYFAATLVIVLEIKKLTGSTTDIVLGEMWYSNTNQTFSTGGKAVCTFINPIPE